MKMLITLLIAISSHAFAAQFSDYAVTPVKVGHIPKLTGADAVQFRTRARELLNEYRRGQTTALAGHMIFTTFGCGTECVVLLGINLLNGETRIIQDVTPFDTDYRENSRLVIVNRGGMAMSYGREEQREFVVDRDMNFEEIKSEAR